jgi:hypothetical protein
MDERIRRKVLRLDVNSSNEIRLQDDITVMEVRFWGE